METEEVIREGTWDCPGCGKANRGRDIKCDGCGQSRENVEFKYDENAAEVTGGDELKVATGGADWVCAYCSTSNRAATAKCRQCGAGRSEGKQRAVTDLPLPSANTSGPSPASAAYAGPSPGPYPGGLPWIVKVLACCGLLMFAGCAALVMLAMQTSEQKLRCHDMHWVRHIQIERLAPVQERGWDVPAGGRVIEWRDEVHHHDHIPSGTRQVERTYTEQVQDGTKRVKTGTKNLGNGYFKDIYENRPVYKQVRKTRWETETVYRDVPVYRKRYLYEVDRWGPARTVDTAGIQNPATWGDPALGPKEREAGRSEEYTCKFSGGGKTYDWRPTADQFAKLKPEVTYTVIVNGLGGVNSVKFED